MLGFTNGQKWSKIVVWINLFLQSPISGVSNKVSHRICFFKPGRLKMRGVILFGISFCIALIFFILGVICELVCQTIL